MSSRFILPSPRNWLFLEGKQMRNPTWHFILSLILGCILLYIFQSTQNSISFHYETFLNHLFHWYFRSIITGHICLSPFRLKDWLSLLVILSSSGITPQEAPPPPIWILQHSASGLLLYKGAPSVWPGWRLQCMEKPRHLSASCRAGSHANKAYLSPAFHAATQERTRWSRSNGNDKNSSKDDTWKSSKRWIL